MLYLYVPYRDQDELPVFDTALPDLNPVELFRTNRYVGADRVSDANQVAYGCHQPLLDGRDGTAVHLRHLRARSTTSRRRA